MSLSKFPKYLILTVVIGLAVIAAPPAASAQTPPVVSDGTLDNRIEAIIEKDPQLDQFGIDVDVAKGMVTLSGKVRTAAQKAHAETVAKIAGVNMVHNNIVVDPNAPMGTKAERAAAKTKEGTNKAIDATKSAAEKTADKTKEIAGDTKDKSKEIAKKTADKTKEIVSTTGEVITDSWIRTKINAKMVDEDTLKGSAVNVDSRDHVVTLKGTAKSAAGKARAEAIAKDTEGVKRVINQIVVKP